MKFQQALHNLAKFFSLNSEKFLDLPKDAVINWADELPFKGQTAPYQLKHWQHNFLVGMPYEISL